MSPLKSTFGAASAFGWLPRGAAKTNITGAESTLWAGGGAYSYGYNQAAGGGVVKYTNDTLNLGTTYTITIGAANNGSSALGRTATSSQASSYNNVNGSTTTYSTNGSGVFVGGYYYDGRYYWYDSRSLDAAGGAPGAGGNGGNGSLNLGGGFWQSGAGGAAFSAVTSSGLAGFPTTVGRGAAGEYQPVNGQVYDTLYGYFFWASGMLGNYGPSGANTGNGQTLSPQTITAGSGGFTMRYSDTFLPLTTTTGTVVYLKSGGYHNYFWKSSGSFEV